MNCVLKETFWGSRSFFWISKFGKNSFVSTIVWKGDVHRDRRRWTEVFGFLQTFEWFFPYKNGFWMTLNWKFIHREFNIKGKWGKCLNCCNERLNLLQPLHTKSSHTLTYRQKSLNDTISNKKLYLKSVSITLDKNLVQQRKSSRKDRRRIN